jgi:hypothetical protein
MTARRIDDDANIARTFRRIGEQLPADAFGYLHVDLAEDQHGTRFEERHLHRRHRLIGLHALIFFFLFLVGIFVQAGRQNLCHFRCPRGRREKLF